MWRIPLMKIIVECTEANSTLTAPSLFLLPLESVHQDFDDGMSPVYIHLLQCKKPPIAMYDWDDHGRNCNLPTNLPYDFQVIKMLMPMTIGPDNQ